MVVRRRRPGRRGAARLRPLRPAIRPEAGAKKAAAKKAPARKTAAKETPASKAAAKKATGSAAPRKAASRDSIGANPTRRYGSGGSRALSR